MLNSNISFLKGDCQQILSNKKCVRALEIVQRIRNKYIHEPHNIRFGFYVGAKSSCSMGLYYKDSLLTISTVWLSNIVYDLNVIFSKIRDLCVQRMGSCDEEYREHFCYQYIKNLDFVKQNQRLNHQPWEHIDIESELASLDEVGFD